MRTSNVQQGISKVAAAALLVAAAGCGEPPSLPEPPAPVTPVASVELGLDTADLIEGLTLRLTPIVRDSLGTVLNDRPVRWSVAPARIADVSAQGVVLARALGDARIVAQVDERADTALVRVRVRLAALSAGAAHTCGVTTAGSTYCWGRNREGRLGIGTMSSTSLPSRVAVEQTYFTVSAGWELTCASTHTGGTCWGSNRSGQLGSLAKDDAIRPAPVYGGGDLVVVAAHTTHTCGIAEPHRAAYCWGAWGAGQLGADTVASRWPLAVTGDLAFRTLDTGWQFTCGVTTENTAYCWGANDAGQLGRPDAPSTCDLVDRPATPCARTPVAVAGDRTIDTLAIGTSHSCALAPGGAAYCWGANGMGQLGTGSTASVSAPTEVRGAPPFSTLTAGDRHTCGLTADGLAWCWGANDAGQLGSAAMVETCSGEPCSTTPLAVATSLRFRALTAARTAGGSHSCGLATDGLAYCWGSNTWGQLGTGRAGDAATQPVEVSGQR
jgi:alpha-tubulin suppressor-like RCC1 family protein